MKLFNKLGIIAAGSVLSLGFVQVNSAKAATITLGDSAAQVTRGEDFNFTFSAVEKSDGTDGIFTIRARGDYSLNNSLESLSWDIDGVVSQTQVMATSSNLIQSFNYDDNLWEQSFVIDGLDMIDITSDSTVTILLDTLRGVNLNLENAFVEASLQYESKYKTKSQSVPEPASMLGLLAVSATGAASLKRKLAKAQEA